MSKFSDTSARRAQRRRPTPYLCIPAPRAASTAAIIALAAGGCTVGPDYEPPSISVPDRWNAVGGAPDSAESSTPTGDPAHSLAAWWTTLHDPTLDALVRRAVAANLDLRIAQARVREARARRGLVAAERLPSADASAGYARLRESENGPNGFSGETDLFQAGFDASWEIDVFGGVRRGIEAADADLAASVEARRDVLVTLLAEVAQNYVELRGRQRLLDIARDNLDAQRNTLRIIRSRQEAGLGSDLDAAQAEAQVRATESQIPSLRSGEMQAVHRLSVLLGLEPSALAEELSSVAEVPSPPPEVPVGLPSDLLRRRPDIRRAERELTAATARVGVATADLFPRFSLTGSFGFIGTDAGDLAEHDSLAWSIGPSVRWNILDFGRTRSNIAVQGAREEAALARYEQAVLESLREVEDALVAFVNEQARRATLQEAVAANRRAVGLAVDLYQQGLSDFLSVLQSQRDLYASEAALAESDQAVTTALISLYKALGGGWEIERLAADR